MFKLFQTNPYKKAVVKVYRGYGHKHNLVLYGHVFSWKANVKRKMSNRIFPNIIDLLRMFILTPFKQAKVQMQWGNQIIEAKTDNTGHFKLEWESEHSVDAGWHTVNVNLINNSGKIAATGEGGVYIPHSTQYAFISDIDDTVMVSHSASPIKKLLELSLKNPQRRGIFKDVVTHYQLLAGAQTTDGVPNPFFYVSSSEWNLYDYLADFFSYNGLPKGAFLLNTVKRWYELLNTGGTGHQGKLLRIVRILETFPKQQFILLGDNSQKDPSIYQTIAQKYADRIFAVYIRNIRPSKKEEAAQILENIKQQGIHACLYNNSAEAIAHSKQIDLVL